MIRLLVIICSIIVIPSYALISGDVSKKQIPFDVHLDHPDHVPHHGGKDPIKKVTHDEIVFPRKKKKKIGFLVA